jgi:hypothetical protein
MKMNEMYETPMVEAIDVEVERGFASTGDPDKDNTPDWPEIGI